VGMGGGGRETEGSVGWEHERFDRPHYERIGALADNWGKELGASDDVVRVLKEGILDVPENPVWGLGEMPVIPQDAEELNFGLAEIANGLRSDSCLWEELGKVEAEALKADGFIVASAFVHWEGEAEDGKTKGCFVQNLKPNKDSWGKGSVKMEKAAGFAAGVEKEDHFISFDI
jgi:hypothetical protein